jgi:monoterpene epsilon-lactone hydrolase
MDDASAARTGDIHLDARVIPIPESLSPEAQAYLRATPVAPRRILPALDDKAAWREAIRKTDEERLPLLSRISEGAEASLESLRVGEVDVHLGTPTHLAATDRDKALLYIHGGALVFCGGELVKHFALGEASRRRFRVYAVDYRMPPDHPFPVGLDDCVDVYRFLLTSHRPENIAVYGISAGGNLAAAAALKIRDQGLPAPGAVGLFTPEVDLTETGDSFSTLTEIDCVAPRKYPECNALYAGGADLSDPYVSPLFGDFAKGYPPTFLQAGTRDIFLSNAVRMHRALRRAGVDAQLHVWEAMPHGGFGGRTPEDEEMRQEFRRFLETRLGRPRT